MNNIKCKPFIKITAFILIWAIPLLADDFVKFQTARAEFSKGIILYNNGNYLAAVEYFRNALKRYPDYISAKDYIARSYKLAGFTDAAIAEFEALTRLMPNNPVFTSKLQSLRYREFLGNREPKFTDYVRNQEIKSVDMKKMSFQRPMDVAVDREKNVYITSFDAGRLTKIDLNGKGVFAIDFGRGSQLYGIDCNKDKLVISDYKKDRVLLLNTSGDVISEFGKTGNLPGEFQGPEGVCFDDKGNIYVVDNGNSRIQKFSPEGKFLFEFGKKGEYEGELNSPCGIAILDGVAYITDRLNRRIACFDESGNFLKNILKNEFNSPRGISATGKKLMICDERKGLTWYDPATEAISQFKPLNENEEESFIRLFASAYDNDSFLYCLDYSEQSVKIFSPVERLYSNLDLDIAAIDSSQFPVIACYVYVRNREGNPVYNLDSRNFTIVEDNAPINQISVNHLKAMTNSVSSIFCVDRSNKALEYAKNVPWAAEFFFRSMRKNDAVKIVDFNSDYFDVNEFDWSMRRNLKLLETGEYAQGKKIGRTLYNSITNLVSRLNRRAVVLITDGSVAPDSFDQYSENTVIQYAKANYVPIYIISFNSPDEALVNIAKSTGGEVIRASQVNSLRTLYDKIKNTPEYRYILVYSTFKNKEFMGWWSDVRIDVNYKNLIGNERGGYFVPEKREYQQN